MNRMRLLAATAAVLALGAGAGTAAAAARTPAGGPRPHIVARPVSVMVQHRTSLHGSGFKPNARLVIWECSTRHWVVPMNVCNHRNAVKVRTDGHGRFTTRFRALVCPSKVARGAGTRTVPAGFARTCYVGVPRVEGVDTVSLLGAAKITVTGP